MSKSLPIEQIYEDFVKWVKRNPDITNQDISFDQFKETFEEIRVRAEGLGFEIVWSPKEGKSK